MPIAPLRSFALFRFAKDGGLAWMRGSGSRLFAVEEASGAVVREVRLDPAPFGITWSIEQAGRFFVVKDDHEISAYEASSGARLWKRSGPTKAAFVSERPDGKFITIAPAGDAIDVMEADLETGVFEPKLRVEGSMKYIGANGAILGDLIVFATDQRDVWAIETGGYRVRARHTLFGSRVLPPVVSTHGMHIAWIEQRTTGAVTNVATIDQDTATITRQSELPGAAYALSAGTAGLLIDVRRGSGDMLERVAFRPDAPGVRLAITKNVNMSLAKDAFGAPRLPAILGIDGANVASVAADVAATPQRGDRRSEIPPPPRSLLARAQSQGDGFAALLTILDARSPVLSRLIAAFDDSPMLLSCMRLIGLTLLDPRIRWSARPGRDPCLLDVAEEKNGDYVAAYYYPPARGGKLAVVRVSRSSGDTEWLTDDFDLYVASLLDEANASTPDLVRIATDGLDAGADFPRPLPRPAPPRWFFEAHNTPWTIDDADQALRDGDIEGAERMLVSVGRSGDHAAAKERLVTVYTMLDWHHQRATVVETW